jgi:hypothetical protein
MAWGKCEVSGGGREKAGRRGELQHTAIRSVGVFFAINFRILSAIFCPPSVILSPCSSAKRRAV